jgi:hypothetical protein
MRCSVEDVVAVVPLAAVIQSTARSRANEMGNPASR